MPSFLTQSELNKLLGPAVGKVEKPTHNVILYSEFKAPEIREYDHYAEKPFIDMSLPVNVSPLTADVTDITDENWVTYPLYRDGERIYEDDKVWEITAGSEKYYVVVFEMNDPSGGLFGAFGSWTPYQTVLFDYDKKPISQHAEAHGADHFRITDCTTTEAMIRHLTVWNMVDSTYRSEIAECNEELRQYYKELIALRKKIQDTHRRREAMNNSEGFIEYDIGKNTYEEFLNRNLDLKML